MCGNGETGRSRCGYPWIERDAPKRLASVLDLEHQPGPSTNEGTLWKPDVSRR